MKVLIDFREKDLWNLLSTTELKFKENKDIILKQENLDLGDIQIFVDNKLVSIIERKTMSDLSSSIKDGRYREQKSRLKKLNINNHNKLYLFEGQVFGEDCLSPKNSKFCNVNGMAFNILLSGIVNTYIRDNLSIYRTKNLNESVKFLSKLIDKTYEHKDEILKISQFVDTHAFQESQETHESQETCDAEYLSTLKLKKKINLTGKDCYIAQLAQITGVSINIDSLYQIEHILINIRAI